VLVCGDPHRLTMVSLFHAHDMSRVVQHGFIRWISLENLIHRAWPRIFYTWNLI
jgi:hypothetical protein